MYPCCREIYPALFTTCLAERICESTVLRILWCNMPSTPVGSPTAACDPTCWNDAQPNRAKGNRWKSPISNPMPKMRQHDDPFAHHLSLDLQVSIKWAHPSANFFLCGNGFHPSSWFPIATSQNLLSNAPSFSPWYLAQDLFSHVKYKVHSGKSGIIFSFGRVAWL